MASFTTRIELQDASAEDYEALHNAMDFEGFTRTISSNEGTQYLLPDAEYNFIGTVQKSEVLGMAKKAVAEVGKTAKILVTESAGRTWSNLERQE